MGAAEVGECVEYISKEFTTYTFSRHIATYHSVIHLHISFSSYLFLFSFRVHITHPLANFAAWCWAGSVQWVHQRTKNIHMLQAEIKKGNSGELKHAHSREAGCMIRLCGFSTTGDITFWSDQLCVFFCPIHLVNSRICSESKIRCSVQLWEKVQVVHIDDNWNWINSTLFDLKIGNTVLVYWHLFFMIWQVLGTRQSLLDLTSHLLASWDHQPPSRCVFHFVASSPPLTTLYYKLQPWNLRPWCHGNHELVILIII